MIDNMYNFDTEEVEKGSAVDLGQSLLAQKQKRLAESQKEQEKFAQGIAVAEFAVGAGKWALDEKSKEFDINQSPLKNKYLSTMKSAQSMINVSNVINSDKYGGNYTNYLIDTYLPFALQATQEKYPAKDARFYQAEARKISEQFAEINAPVLKQAVKQAYMLPTNQKQFDAEFDQIKDFYVSDNLAEGLFRGIKKQIRARLDPENIKNSKRDIKNIENQPMFERHRDFEKTFKLYQALFPETSDVILDQAAKESPFKYEKMELKFVQGSTSTKLNPTTGDYEEVTEVIPVMERLRVGDEQPEVSVIENKTLRESLTFRGLDAQMTKLLTDVTGIGMKSLNPRGVQLMADEVADLKAKGQATPNAIQKVVMDLTSEASYTDLAGVTKQEYLNDNNTRVRWWDMLVERGFAQSGVGTDITAGVGYLTPQNYAWTDPKATITATQQGLDYESWAGNEYDRLTGVSIDKQVKDMSPREVVNQFNEVFRETDFYKGLSVNWLEKYNTQIMRSRNSSDSEYMKQQVLTGLSADANGRLKNPFPLMDLVKWDDQEVVKTLEEAGWIVKNSQGQYEASLDPTGRPRQFFLTYEPTDNTFKLIPHKG